MTEVKHTPGPWELTRANAGEWNINAAEPDDWAIAVVCGGAGLEGPNGRSDENARLIAAAPDLLEALIRLESATRILPPDMDEADSPLAQARAAIASATLTTGDGQ